MNQNKINVYTCQKCGGQIVTKDVDDGVTPFMLVCRVPPGGCKGMMFSSFYSCDQRLEPKYEWFRPHILVPYSSEMREHIRKGGLVIRRIKKVKP